MQSGTNPRPHSETHQGTQEETHHSHPRGQSEAAPRTVTTWVTQVPGGEEGAFCLKGRCWEPLRRLGQEIDQILASSAGPCCPKDS